MQSEKYTIEQFMEDIKTKHENLRTFAKWVKRRLRDDYDLVVAICGREGVSKSTLSIILGILIDEGFDLQKNVSYIPNEKEIKDEFSKVPQYGFYMVDEAVRALYKMNFQNKLQQVIVQLYATERYKNKCTVMIIPRFLDFTEQFRNWRINVLIQVVDRGKALVYKRDDINQFTQDPWYIKRSQVLNEKFLHYKSITNIGFDKLVNIQKKNSTFWFDLTYPKLPTEVEEEYKALKEASRTPIEDEDEEEQLKGRAGKYREQIIKLMGLVRKEQLPYTQNEIAEIMGVKPAVVSKYFKKLKEQGGHPVEADTLRDE